MSGLLDLPLIMSVLCFFVAVFFQYRTVLAIGVGLAFYSAFSFTVIPSWAVAGIFIVPLSIGLFMDRKAYLKRQEKEHTGYVSTDDQEEETPTTSDVEDTGEPQTVYGRFLMVLSEYKERFFRRP